MKISREIIINGTAQRVDYELTGIELERCFNEFQSIHDRNEVVHQLKDLEYEDLENIPEDIISDIASQFRDKMDNLMDEIILDVIGKNEEVLEQYKQKWKTFTCDVTQTRTRTYSIRAKDEQEAEDMMKRYFDHHEAEVGYDMSDELPDYDFGWIQENMEWCDPDEADITEEDD